MSSTMFTFPRQLAVVCLSVRSSVCFPLSVRLCAFLAKNPPFYALPCSLLQARGKKRQSGYFPASHVKIKGPSDRRTSNSNPDPGVTSSSPPTDDSVSEFLTSLPLISVHFHCYITRPCWSWFSPRVRAPFSLCTNNLRTKCIDSSVIPHYLRIEFLV